MTTTRVDAIERLALIDLGRLSPAARAEQLEVMLLEDWSDSPGWGELPPAVREEIEAGGVLHDPCSQRYDAVLLIWLRFRYLGAPNAYLRHCLKDVGSNVAEVTGPEDRLLPCPCCGRASLLERSSCQSCKVCWWEDDGQDDANADAVWGGPNYGVSLTQGRVNFLVHGISDPTREDLRSHQEPPEKYAVGRRFVLSADGCLAMDPESQWESQAFER